MRPLVFLPAILAVSTDVLTAAIVKSRQQDYPLRFLIFQLVMVGLALLLATRYRQVWVVAFLLLIAGMVVTGFSVGFLYAPTVAAAGWVMVRRLDGTAPDVQAR